MPRRGTMLLRNSWVPVLLFFLFFSAIACRHLVAATPIPSIPNQQSAQSPQANSQEARSPTAPTSGATPQDPQPQSQKIQSQPAQALPAQAPPVQDQGESSTDSGVFVFKKEVEEVVVHATVQ